MFLLIQFALLRPMENPQITVKFLLTKKLVGNMLVKLIPFGLCAGRKENKGQRVIKVTRARKVLKDRKVSKAIKATPVKKATKATLAPKDQLA